MAEEKKLNYSSFCHNLAEEQTILAVGNKRMANMTIIEKMCRIAEKMQPEEGNSRNMSFSNMENSIQNIILQEMEDLDGILIATTNLTTNLDKAFERRFLYKIRFERPSREARVSIWRAMMPSLSEEEAKILASNYDFSGGQIENIVRKREIQSIIDSTEPGFNDVLSFCSEEVIGNGTGRRRIGF